MKYIFIVNPLAGKEKKRDVIENEIANLSCKNSCEIYETKGIKDATRFVKEWCIQNPNEEVRFIACGGDGTINEVFNGAVGFENVSVTCYPCGSGNDFVKSYGGADKFLNIENLIKAKTVKLDLMKVGELYSDNVTNFGFDTTVAMMVNSDREKNGHGSKSSYTKGIVKALMTSMNNKFQVIADGEVLNPSGHALLCTIANGMYVGGSFKCAPRAIMDDGLLEVCLVNPISRIKFFSMISDYTNGRHLDNPKYKDIMIYRRAKKIEVIGSEDFAYSLDGEIIHENHFTVEVVPQALNLAVPD